MQTVNKLHTLPLLSISYIWVRWRESARYETKSVADLASFPGSTSQLFFARSKISGKKSWEVEPGNEAIADLASHQLVTSACKYQSHISTLHHDSSMLDFNWAGAIL